MRRHWKLMSSKAQEEHVARAQSEKQAYASALESCREVSQGKSIQADIVSSGKTGDTFLSNLIVRMYGRCGSIQDAEEAFENIQLKNVFSWTIMITAYARNGHYVHSMVVYRRMLLQGVKPDSVTLSTILGVCSALGWLRQGKVIHDSIRELPGWSHDSVLGNSLITMYSRCGCVHQAWEVFSFMEERTSSTWNSMLAAFASSGRYTDAIELYRSMVQEQEPDKVTLLQLAGVCSDMGPEGLDLGRELHKTAVKKGFISDLKLANSLIDMFGKCGSLEDARSLFQSISRKDVVSWNTIIAAHTGRVEAFELYREMDVKPDRVTFIILLETCSTLQNLEEGRRVHETVLRSVEGFSSDAPLQNSLLLMYAQCGQLEEAERLFDNMRDGTRTVSSWNSMIAAYKASAASPTVAFQVFRRMCLEGVQANKITLVTLIDQLCCQLLFDDETGRQHHLKLATEIQRFVDGIPGMKPDVSVSTSLLLMYCRGGDLRAADMIFEKMVWKDVVAWTAMITALTQHQFHQRALLFYSLMDLEGCGGHANEVTFSIILSACSHLGHVSSARLVHRDVAAAGYESHLVVGTAIVDMYGKCGSAAEAKEAFDKISCKNSVACWNAVMHSQCNLASFGELFGLMSLEGVSPDSVTLTVLLFTLSHTGESDLTMLHTLLDDVKLGGGDTSSKPAAEVHRYAMIIDMLSRSGRLEEAEEVMDYCPYEPGLAKYTGVLSACSIATDLERAMRVAGQSLNVCPVSSSTYVLLANIGRTFVL